MDQTVVTTPTPPLMTLRGVTRRFDALVAVDNLSLDIAPGETVGLIGPNGSGKTTLLNMLSGVDRPSSGAITFDGRNLALQSAHAIASMGIARTFQTPRIYNELDPLAVCAVADRALHNLSAAAAWSTPWRLLASGARAAIKHVAPALEAETEAAAQLPYGSQRLVEVARCFASSPKLVLLDEATSGLGKGEFMALAKFFREEGAARKLTMVIVDHKIEFLREVCSRLICLVSGKLIADGEVDAVERDARVREAYFGVAA